MVIVMEQIWLEENQEYEKKEISRHNEILVLGKVVDAEWMEEVKRMILTEQREKRRKAQLLGIQKALEKKDAGKGTYGRPKIQLPEDFKEQIIQRIERNEKLAKYRKEIGMKRSTFYTCAKKCKDEWIKEKAQKTEFVE